MNTEGQARGGHCQVDHADIVSLDTASGDRAELMRTSYQRQVFPRHSHDYFTLGLMLRGAGTLWHRGAEHIAYRGDVVVIPPGEIHTGGQTRGTTVLSYLAVHLSTKLFAAYASADESGGERVPYLSAGIIRDKIVAAQLRRLDLVMRGVQGAAAIDDGIVDDALHAAIAQLLRHGETPLSSPSLARTREPEFVRIVREVIADCYADNTQTSLRALAVQVGVTTSHLVRVFTHSVGLSPHQYLLQMRVSRASTLLAQGVQLSFVAAMTGFVDQSHLTTQFKRFVGTTPASYQRSVSARAGLHANPRSSR